VSITTIRATLHGLEILKSLLHRLELLAGDLDGPATRRAHAAATAMERQMAALHQEVQQLRLQRAAAAAMGPDE
jgi:hypothetical protein